MKIDALIPARGGSKRIPMKNIKKYAGKPLIAWSIQIAKECPYIRNVYVSTDNDRIAKAAYKYGAIVIRRPADISGDLSTDLECFQHFIHVVDDVPDAIVHLRPTYPNRNSEILCEIIERFIKGGKSFTSIRSVVPTLEPPFKAYILDEARLVPLTASLKGIKEPYDCPTQLLPKTYWHNGYIDVMWAKTIRTGSMSGRNIMAYCMDPREIDDIDTVEEWERSERKVI